MSLFFSFFWIFSILGPLAAIMDFFRRCGVAGGERVPLAPLGYYFTRIMNKKFSFVCFLNGMPLNFAYLWKFEQTNFILKSEFLRISQRAWKIWVKLSIMFSFIKTRDCWRFNGGFLFQLNVLIGMAFCQSTTPQVWFLARATEGILVRRAFKKRERKWKCSTFETYVRSRALSGFCEKWAILMPQWGVRNFNTIYFIY